MTATEDLNYILKQVRKRIDFVQKLEEDARAHRKSITRDVLLVNYENEMNFLFDLLQTLSGKKITAKKIAKK